MKTPDPRLKPSSHSTSDMRPNTMPPSPASEGEDKFGQPENEESSIKRKRRDDHSRTGDGTYCEPSKKQRSEDNDYGILDQAVIKVLDKELDEKLDEKLGGSVEDVFGRYTFKIKEYIKTRELKFARKDDVKNHESSIKEIGKNLSKVESGVAVVEEQIIAQLEDVTKLQGDVINLTRDVTKHTETLAANEYRFTSISKATDAIEKTSVTHEDQLTSISRTTDTMNKTLATHEDKLTSISKTTDTMSKALNDIHNVRTSMSKVNAKVEGLEIDGDSSRERVKNIENQVATLKSSVEFETRSRIRSEVVQDRFDTKLKDLEDMQYEFSGDLDDLDFKYEKALAKAERRYGDALAEVKEEHKNALAKAEENHEDALAHLEEKYKSALAIFPSEMSRQLEGTIRVETALAKLGEEHNVELANLRKEMGKMLEDAMHGVRLDRAQDQIKLQQIQMELKDIQTAQATQISTAVTDAVEALRSTFDTQIEELAGRVARMEEAKATSDRSVSTSQEQYKQLERRVENFETLRNNIDAQVVKLAGRVDRVEQAKETVDRGRQSTSPSVEKWDKIDRRIETLEAYQKSTLVHLANNRRNIDSISRQQEKLDTSIPSLATLATKKALADAEIRISSKIEKGHAELTKKCEDRLNHADQTCHDRMDGANTRIAQLENTEIHVSPQQQPSCPALHNQPF
jgi:chromosome segregation ATPase